jgi:nucleoside-diphosphate-sugar epimerase
VTLVVLGYGYTASAFVERVRARFDRAVATVRTGEKAARLAAAGVTGRILSDGEVDPALAADLRDATALLVSIPPGEGGDPVLPRLRPPIAAAPRLGWIGYLSTIGVYGDHQGAWIDESAELRPSSTRSRARVAAEEAWLALGRETGRAVQVFRLAGIYGPGRSPYQKVLDGTAKRIVKPGQVFNRIHADDIAAVLEASLDRPRPGAIYNVADDEPAPPQDVVTFAATLAGRPLPPEIPFDEAQMSPMARSFYGDNKRIANRLLRDELGVRLAYPTYREGLAAVAAAASDQAAKRFAAGPK